MKAIHSPDVACLVIPPVGGFAAGDWEATARAMRAGARLDFRQSWLSQQETDFRPAQAWLGVQGADLVVYAVLEDDQPANRTTQWNEATWMKGDVVELFFQAEDRPGYHEFHVTPENQRLQLFFPSLASFHEHRGHRHWSVAEPLFESAARINATGTGWEAVMRVKLARVLAEPRDDGSRKFRFSLSRYDYQPGRQKPVKSATTAFPPWDREPDFHHIPSWSWAEAARG